MKIAFISTGTELLKGSAVNTNLSFFGSRLAEAGIPLFTEIACGDTAAEISGAVSAALRNCQILLISGGLGPTSDDITVETVARFFGKELHQDPVLTEKVTEFWNRLDRGFSCPKNQYKQAMVPEGGSFLPNPVGSASGLAFSSVYGGEERHVFLIPGPPSEFQPMIVNEVLPRLLPLIPERKKTCGFLCAGIGESVVTKMVEKEMLAIGVEVAYCVNASGTRLFLSSCDEEKVKQASVRAHEIIGDSALPDGSLNIIPYIAELLREKQWHFGAAESCTGGMLSAQWVELAGISDIYNGTIVSYANSVKENLLGVPAAVLSGPGAVSAECAAAMVKGAAKALGAECAVSITGVAGPSGGTPEKPVGTVFIGALIPGRCEVKAFKFRGSREMIRTRSAAKAMDMLMRLLRGEELK